MNVPARMLMTCAEVEKFVQAFVDGELVGEEAELIERHIGGCARCAEVVSFQQTFKANVHARLRRPEAPASLKTNVLAALDAADARGEGPVPRLWKRVMPATAAVAAAAAIVILLGTVVQSRADSPIVKDAIRGYEKVLPVEVGCCEDQVRSWMVGKVPVPVRPPVRRAQAPNAQLVGARIGHLRGEDAAELVYQVGDSRVTVYVFDPSGIQMSAPHKRIIGSREVYLDGERGYNVAFYRDRGVGYAFASDLDQDQMIRLVSASLTDDDE